MKKKSPVTVPWMPRIVNKITTGEQKHREMHNRIDRIHRISLD